MPSQDFNNDEINKLINSAWTESAEPTILRSKYQDRLDKLGISFNQSVDNLGIEYRTVNGILDGTLERIDFLSLLKIAQFLGITYKRITEMYADAAAHKHHEELAKSEIRTFILSNFDLPVLKSIGVIDSIKDFDHIEQRLKDVLGLQSIRDYEGDDFEAALSSGAVVPKDTRSRKYFLRKARAIFKAIDNPNIFSKEALIEYIPKIRWQSIDIQSGLKNVMRALYNVGVTVIYLPKIPALAMRGATFPVNGKPCIVLTDYKGFYPTLWFALIHELFHVIFDWEEIVRQKYHLSIEGDNPREAEADEFARDYMFPLRKLEAVSSRIDDRLFVREYAMDNHVHPSIVYAHYAFQNNSADDNYWQKFQREKVFPPLRDTLDKLSNGLDHTTKPTQYAAYYKLSIFNND